MRWALLLVLLATSASARPDRLSVYPRLDRRDRLGASSASSPILLSLSLLPPDSECSGTPPDGVTFTRSSVATCIDSTGKAFALAANQARATSKGLLVEGATTNALLRTRATSTAPWTCPTCGATTLGMDNLTTVPRIAVGTASQAITVATGARTVSVYVRTVGGLGCSVSLSADATTTGVVPVSDIGDWQRVSLAYTSDADVTIALAVSGTGCSVAADYWQDEAGAIATSPVVSAGTAATRAADTPTVPTSGLLETRGCARMTVAPGWAGIAPGSWVLSNGSTSSRLLYTAASDHMRSAGGAWSMTVVAGFAVGVGVPWTVSWSAADGAKLLNVASGAEASDLDASEWPAFGPSLRIGQLAPLYASSIVLGNTPGACQ